MRKSWERYRRSYTGVTIRTRSEFPIGTDPCLSTRRTGSENVFVRNRTENVFVRNRPSALPRFRDWAPHCCSTGVKRRSDRAQNWFRQKTSTKDPRKSLVTALKRYRDSYTEATIRNRSEYSIGTRSCVVSRRTGSGRSKLESRTRE